MRVTDFLVGKESMSAHDIVRVVSRSEGSQDTLCQEPGIQQLALLAGLCNAGEFDAATSYLPL